MWSLEAQSPSPQGEALRPWPAAPQAPGRSAWLQCDFDPCSALGCVATAWHQRLTAHRLLWPVTLSNGPACL